MDDTEKAGSDNGATSVATVAAASLNEDAKKTLGELKSGGIFGIFSFDRMYFPVVARFLLIVITLMLVVGGAILIVTTFLNSVLSGILSLVMVPVFVIVTFINVRLWFEMIMVAFKINDGIQELNRKIK